MQILLNPPTINDQKRTNKGLMIPRLALYILEGLSPPEHAIKIIEEKAENIDLDFPCNLVGISCMTASQVV